jgi:acylphosphatase
VVAEGPRDDLEKLLRQLWRGPASAYVIKIRTEWKEATGEYQRFGTLHTF